MASAAAFFLALASTALAAPAGALAPAATGGGSQAVTSSGVRPRALDRLLDWLHPVEAPTQEQVLERRRLIECIRARSRPAPPDGPDRGPESAALECLFDPPDGTLPDLPGQAKMQLLPCFVRKVLDASPDGLATVASREEREVVRIVERAQIECVTEILLPSLPGGTEGSGRALLECAIPRLFAMYPQGLLWSLKREPDAFMRGLETAVLDCTLGPDPGLAPGAIGAPADGYARCYRSRLAAAFPDGLLRSVKADPERGRRTIRSISVSCRILAEYPDALGETWSDATRSALLKLMVGQLGTVNRDAIRCWVEEAALRYPSPRAFSSVWFIENDRGSIPPEDGRWWQGVTGRCGGSKPVK